MSESIEDQNRIRIAEENRWLKLGEKEYRAAFAEACAKKLISMQIRRLMKQHGFTQEKLAQESGLKQGVVSRAADPDYGNLTMNTIMRIAAGFDVAFIGAFVPFSELSAWMGGLSEEKLDVASFEQETRSLREKEPDAS